MFSESLKKFTPNDTSIPPPALGGASHLAGNADLAIIKSGQNLGSRRNTFSLWTRAEQVHWDEGTRLLVKLEASFPVIDSKKSGECVSLSGRRRIVWDRAPGIFPRVDSRSQGPSNPAQPPPGFDASSAPEHRLTPSTKHSSSSSSVPPPPTSAGNSRLHPQPLHNEAVAEFGSLRTAWSGLAASHLCYYLISFYLGASYLK